jgi:hypothetical protein
MVPEVEAVAAAESISTRCLDDLSDSDVNDDGKRSSSFKMAAMADSSKVALASLELAHGADRYTPTSERQNVQWHNGNADLLLQPPDGRSIRTHRSSKSQPTSFSLKSPAVPIALIPFPANHSLTFL